MVDPSAVHGCDAMNENVWCIPVVHRCNAMCAPESHIFSHSGFAASPLFALTLVAIPTPCGRSTNERLYCEMGVNILSSAPVASVRT
jgi:hypothetical protein